MKPSSRRQQPAALQPQPAVQGEERSSGTHRQRKRGTELVLWWAVVVMLATVFLLPFLWLLDLALKTYSEVSAYPVQLLPAKPQWDNFQRVLTTTPFWHYARNSIVLTALQTLPTIVTSAMVGFAFARLKGRGKNVLFGLVLAMMMIPQLVTIVPTYILFARIPGMIGSYYPWLLWGLGGTPLYIFLYRQFFRGIPVELMDAAVIDGCGRVTIFARIFLPLSKPVVATVAILSFINVWGDWFTPGMFLSSDNYPLATMIANSFGPQNITSAANILFIVPVLAIFFAGQRYFVLGIATSGLKR